MDSFEVCDEIDKCLQRLESDHYLAVATSRLHVQSLPLYKNIFCFDQSQYVHRYLNSFMIRSDFKVKSIFNHMIELAVTSGLVSKFKHDIRFYHKTTTLSDEFDGLHWREFSFFVYLINLPIIISAIIVILIEMVIFKKSHSLNANNYWKFLDKLICGRRCFCLLKPTN